MFLTQYAIRQKTSTFILAIALIVFGIISFTSLPINLLPEIIYPNISVNIGWEGATPDEIQKNIAENVERTISTVDGIHEMSGQCNEGRYSLSLTFDYSIPINTAFMDVVSKMQLANRYLPEECDAPVIQKRDPSQIPIIEIMISSENWNLVQLRDWTENWFLDHLSSVSGVASTDVVGGLKREIQIKIDTAALKKYNVPLSLVLSTIQAENAQVSAGEVRVKGNIYNTRTLGNFETIKEIESILLKDSKNQKILLKDVAKVIDSHEDVRVYARLNGMPSIRIRVNKQAESNTVDVIDHIQQLIVDIEDRLPLSVHISTMEDQSVYIRASVDGIVDATFLAIFLLLTVVFLFLGDLRQAMVLVLVLPVTLIFNFAVIHLFGFSLNIFSLGGMVIAIGVIVDNSTVVIENITRFRRKNPEDTLEHLTLNATKEVSPAIIASTLSFLALFMPFLMMYNTISLLFKELIVVISGIVIISLLLAVTLTPMLFVQIYSYLPLSAQKKVNFAEKIFDSLKILYGKSLELILAYRWLTIMIFLGCLIVAIIIVTGLKTEFLPAMDDGRIGVTIQLPTGTLVDETNRVTLQMEQYIAENPAVFNYVAFVGGRARATVDQMEYFSQIDIQLKPAQDRTISTTKFVRMVSDYAKGLEIVGGRINVRQKQIRGLPRSTDTSLEYKIYGQDIKKLYEYAKAIEKILSNKPYISHITNSLDLNNPEFQVRVDRAKASDLGISVHQIATTLKTLVTGTIASKFRENNNYYDIRVRVPNNTIQSKGDIENFLLEGSNGNFTKLSQIARIDEGVGPVGITRENQIPVVVLGIEVKGISLGESIPLIETDIEAIESSLPIGYTHRFGGQAEQMNEAFFNTLILFLLALFFSFIILVVQFNKWSYAIQIVLSIPICLAGMVFILWLTGYTAGSTVIIGMLIVVAAAINDGVLVITYAEQLRLQEGYPVFKAIIESAKIRLRPRMIVTVLAIVGFIPIALNFGGGGEMLQPMAIAAIGGLAFELLVTLFFTPSIYVLITRPERALPIKKPL